MAQNYTLRRIAVGAVLVGIMSLGYIGFCNKKPEPEAQKPQVQLITKPVELEDVKKYVRSHPEHANETLESSLNSLSANVVKLNDKNFLALYKIMKGEFEERPDLSDHLGPNFHSYQKNNVLKQYINGIGTTVKDLAKEGYNTITK